MIGLSSITLQWIALNVTSFEFSVFWRIFMFSGAACATYVCKCGWCFCSLDRCASHPCMSPHRTGCNNRASTWKKHSRQALNISSLWIKYQQSVHTYTKSARPPKISQVSNPLICSISVRMSVMQWGQVMRPGTSVRLTTAICATAYVQMHILNAEQIHTHTQNSYSLS